MQGEARRACPHPTFFSEARAKPRCFVCSGVFSHAESAQAAEWGLKRKRNFSRIGRLQDESVVPEFLRSEKENEYVPQKL
jgi:hypothetical protein